MFFQFCIPLRTTTLDDAKNGVAALGGARGVWYLKFTKQVPGALDTSSPETF